MTKRVVCAAFAVFSAVCAVAMPSRSDLKKVQPTVNELMSEDIAAMKSGKQTPEGAAAKAEELAEMATDEASKFLLYKGAFGLYVQGGKYGAAIAALDKLTAAVKDVPDKVLADIVRSKMDGVKKALAENRVSEVTGKEVAEGALVAQPKTEAKNVNAGQVAASQSADYLNVPIDMRKLSPIKIPLKDATALEFVPIPAGKFHAGRCGRTGLYQSVDVVITRPFLMAKTPLTYAQWRALFGAEHPFERSLRTGRCPPVQVEVYQKLGKSALMACCNFHDSEYALAELNRKGEKMLPKGYVFRLPTLAEAEYVDQEGDKERENVTFSGYAELLTKAGLVLPKEQFGVREDNRLGKYREAWEVSLCPVGTRSPNSYGICDLFQGYLTLDRLGPEVLPPGCSDGKMHPMEIIDGCDRSKAGNVDPLFWTSANEFMVVRRGHLWQNYPLTCQMGAVLRIVIGPDLVAERKAKSR